jgi:Pirin-related protein
MILPKYRNLRRESLPVITLDNGIVARVVAGKLEKVPGYGRIEGPVKDLNIEVEYYDLSIPPNEEFNYEVKEGLTVLAYVLEGSVIAKKMDKEINVESRKTLIFDRNGNIINIKGGEKGGRILLLIGKPIEEPIAWYGPIVMNTHDELIQAFEELRKGTFVKHKATEYDYFKY